MDYTDYADGADEAEAGWGDVQRTFEVRCTWGGIGQRMGNGLADAAPPCREGLGVGFFARIWARQWVGGSFGGRKGGNLDFGLVI